MAISTHSPGKPKLLDTVRSALRSRHYSRRTEASYTAWIRRFILFHGKRHPREMGALEINSFLTHLATGRLIIETGAVPSADPYTFTGYGEPWVVQSWLVSLLYGVVERMSGFGGIRVLGAWWTNWSIMVMAPGAFFVLALFIWFIHAKVMRQPEPAKGAGPS